MSELPDDLAGKTLYAVTMRRESYATIYVYATSQREAEEDAEELSDSGVSWIEEECEVWDSDTVDSIPRGAWAWSGGPDGRDVLREEIV